MPTKAEPVGSVSGGAWPQWPMRRLRGNFAPTSKPPTASIFAIEAVRLATKVHDAGDRLEADGYLGARRPSRGSSRGKAELPALSRSRIAREPERIPSVPGRDPPRRLAPAVGQARGPPQLEHRIGGLERDYDSGPTPYDPRQTHARHGRRHARTRSRESRNGHSGLQGPSRWATITGKLAVVGWGSTFGAIHQAVKNRRAMRAGGTWRTFMCAT